MHCTWLLLAIVMSTVATIAPPAPDCRLLKGLVSDSEVRDRADLTAFYEPASYAPAWIRDGAPTRQAEAMIQALNAADAKGLNAEDYAGTWLKGQLERLRQTPSPQSVGDHARFDVVLTVSALRYVSDLHLGRIDPKLIHPGFDLEHEKINLPEFVRTRLVNADRLWDALSEIDPPFPGYRRTEIALQLYLALAAEDDHKPLPTTGKAVEPGSPYPGAERLARLLRKLGDLPMDVTAPSDRYEGPLVEAVRHFQTRHGLDPDGRIGAATVRQLNVPLKRRVRQLQMTLERYRWAPHQFSHPPVIVNIPEFRLRAMNASFTSETEMKVVVGRAYRTRTPVFVQEMTFVVFRPYWDVPPSIQRGELLPKIARDASYLVRNSYELVSSANKVLTDGVSGPEMLAQLRSGKIRIRQVPGPRNALGLVKFLFPNKYNVYMHGTPATELFSKSRRDFSHGCIRLENPEALAAWVLREKPEWTPARIEQAMHGANTFTVTLEKPIPVLIVYATAVVLENDDVHFFEDIYGHDKTLDQALTSGAGVPRPRE